ncbi:MAG: DEAD/DEAH box helicase [Candidatus Heimdallarchaeota archaeon]|nr:DEAD/DEAH box helicase [Candidatus Heimdallarchaeota archaeon]
MTTSSYLTHPLIKEETIQSRIYQQVMFSTAVKDNSLIILPTGLGKTIIILMLIAKFQLQAPEKQSIIIAPTRPLVDQHYSNFVDLLEINSDEIGIISGSTKPADRKAMWKQLKVIIATPQTLRNDIISEYVDFKQVSLMCVDEAHRAVKDDSTVLCTQQYLKHNPDGRIAGFTASPGNRDTLEAVVHNLGVRNIEAMDERHPNVKPYVNIIKDDQIMIKLSDEFNEVLSIMNNYLKDNLKVLKEIGMLDSIQLSRFSKKVLLALPQKLNKNRGKELEENEFFAGMKAYGQLMIASHAHELVETQGLIAFINYYENKSEEFRVSERRSLRTFLQSNDIKKAYTLSQQLIKTGETHPKFTELLSRITEQIENNPESRMLIFANYKDTVNFLVEELNKLTKIEAHKFVGQTSNSRGKGLSQKKQKIVMDQFRDGFFNVLVSTSVGEEGLDVAQCDLVVFYETIPSTTRLIQRRGRTGRKREGRVIYLITKGTRDEAYYYASQRKRRRLMDDVLEVKKELDSKFKNSSRSKLLTDGFKQSSLDEYSPNDKKSKAVKPAKNEVDNKIDVNIGKKEIENEELEEKLVVIVDHREKGSAIMRALLEQNLRIDAQSIPIGDYIISDEVAIERKTVQDFAQTLQNRELFGQLQHLKESYLKPLLLIEGENLYQSSINPNALRGAIAAISVDMGIPIIWTKDADETAEMIATITRREQLERKRKPQIKKQSGKDLDRVQLNLISTLPEINFTLAKRLLEHFKTPRELFSAHPDELKEVHGIGLNKANSIDVILSKPFKNREETELKKKENDKDK